MRWAKKSPTQLPTVLRNNRIWPSPCRLRAAVSALVECGVFKLIQLLFSSRTALIAENLFLRKQLALFQERGCKSRRSTADIRTAMVLLSRFFDWREALETFIKWHRAAFRLFWKWKCRKWGS